MSENTLRCFIDLRRNDIEFPFVTTMLDVEKQSMQNKVSRLLTEQSDRWIMYSLANLDEDMRMTLEDTELVDKDLLQYKDSAIFIKEDRSALICVNMEDHILIRVKARYGEEKIGIRDAKDIALMLSDGTAFAKDDRIGWLTAKPQYAGTGLQVTYLLHLPMLTMMQQIKANAAKINTAHRFLLRSFIDLDDKNAAALYYFKNLFTAYSDSDKLLLAIHEISKEITTKEDNLRQKILRFTSRSIYSDQIYRAYGILKYARRLTQTEFLAFWSKIRLGANAGLLPIKTNLVDSLLGLTTKTMLIEKSDGVHDDHAIHFNRADTVREALNGGI
ncbi:MAG: hypothetical protein GX781_06710 [Clostridiales bacterium]|nr:hypothetical protein [Clostridiales bacterium]